jgi:FixJ family two-component response regulator
MLANHPLAPGTKLSVVDDDDSMREAIMSLIDSIGVSIEEFSSAQDFLRSERRLGFDCLILDVRMPGMNGLELQRRLAADQNRTPIVFITAHDSDEERTKALKAGAAGFLRKPFTEQELLGAISDALVIGKNLPRKEI